MDDSGATAAAGPGNESGSNEHAASAKAASGGTKELSKEQLLGYIKKLKHKVKEVETELQQTKTQHAALQADHMELEERAAGLAEKDRETDNRLIQAAEDVHQAEADGESRAKALQARVDELERGLEKARRAQDGQIELAERAKRAEGELRRAQDRITTLEAEVAASVASAATAAAAEASTQPVATGDAEEMVRLQVENEEMNGKLKMLIDRYKALQIKAKSVVEEKTGLAQELEAAQAASAIAVATAEAATGVQHQLDRAKEELTQVRGECDGLTAELESLRAAAAKAAAVRPEQQEQEQQLVMELEKVRGEREALSAELECLRAAAAEAAVAAPEQQDQSQQHDQQQQQMKEQQLEELLQIKKERDDLAAQLASWRGEAEAREAAHVASQQQHQQALAALQEERETLQSKVAALAQQLDEGFAGQAAQIELERALVLLKEEREISQGKVAAMTGQLVEADAAQAVLMEETRKSIDTHYQEVQRLQGELDATVAAAAAAAAAAASTAAAAAARKPSPLSPSDDAAAAAALAAKEGEVRSLQQQLEGQQSKVDELLATITAAKTEGEGAQARLSEELARAQQQVKEAEGKVVTLEGQKKEQEEMVKRLKTLLAKSRSIIQSRDQELNKSKAAAEAEAAAPSSFMVALRVRAGEEGKEGEEGREVEVWCHVVLPPPPPSAAGAAAAAATSQDELSASSSEAPQQQQQQQPSSLWVKEETVREWTRQALATTPESVASVDSWPAVLQEAWASKEGGLTQALEEERKAKQVLEAEFDKYRARAHAALKKATERSGEDKQRDRLVEEDNARLIEERGQWEGMAQGLEEKVMELEVVLQEVREEQEERMEALERGWERKVEVERQRGMVVLGEAEAKAEMRWRETVAEWSKRLEASEREGDVLEEKIVELEGQLKAAQAAVLAANNAAKAASAAAAMAKATATAQARNEAAVAAAAGRATSKSLSLEHQQQQQGGGGGGGNGQVDDEGKYDPGQRGTNQRMGPSVTPLDIPPPPISSSSSSAGGGGEFGSTSGSGAGGGREGEGDLASLGDQYVVIKQLTADFQSERVRDLQLIAQMQEEMSEMNATQAKLQEQERVLKMALRAAEDSLARERELHAGPMNAEYLKHAIYGLLTAHNDTERLTLLSVIVTMLHFTPEEASKARAATQGGGEGYVGGVKGWISSKLGGGNGGTGGGGGGGVVGGGGR